MKLQTRKLVVSDLPSMLFVFLLPLGGWYLYVRERWFTAPSSLFNVADHERSAHALLWTALVVTIVSPVLGWIRLRYIKRVLESAVPFTGRIVSIRGIGAEGWFRVNYAYEYKAGRRAYEGAASVDEVSLEKWGLRKGGPIELLVPPSRPSRSYLAAEYQIAPASNHGHAMAESAEAAPISDERSMAWSISWQATIFVVGLFGLAPPYCLWFGKASPPMSDHPVVALLASAYVLFAGVGLLLRIEASRLALLALYVCAALAGSALALAHLLGARHVDAPWRVVSATATAWVLAASLATAPCRRLCTRWGRLARGWKREGS